MFAKPRLIPVLSLNSNHEVISTRCFSPSQYIGDPLNIISVYNEFFVDELCVIDIYASREKRSFNINILKNISNICEVPLSVGGGVSSLKNIYEILVNGAEKVILSSAIVENPEFLKEAVNEFGTSSLIVCLDSKKNSSQEYKIYNSSRMKLTDYNLNSFIKRLQDYGLGECIIQSVSNDGTYAGYDIDMLKTALDNTWVPFILSGGCKSLEEIIEISRNYNVSGFAAGSLFAFHDKGYEVLLNYPDMQTFENCWSNAK